MPRPGFQSYLEQRFLDKAFRLIEESGRYSPAGCAQTLAQGLLDTLKKYRRQHRILFLENGQNLGGYNHITRRIVFNKNKLHFLRHDFEAQRAQAASKSCERSLERVEAFENRCLFEFTGILVHEGQHAHQPIYSWNPLRFRECRKRDEEKAFRAEQLWYWMLYQDFGEKYGEAVKALARNAAYDATASPVYRRLDIKAPSLLEDAEFSL